MSLAGERKTVPRSCKNKSLSFKIKALQKDELKGKNKVTNVCVLPVTTGSSGGAWWGSCWIVSVLEKSRDFMLRACLYYLVGETALSWGGPWVILSLGQWRVRVQSQGVAGITTGVLWATGGFSPGRGKTEILCLVSLRKYSGWSRVCPLLGTLRPNNGIMWTTEATWETLKNNYYVLTLLNYKILRFRVRDVHFKVWDLGSRVWTYVHLCDNSVPWGTLRPK